MTATTHESAQQKYLALLRAVRACVTARAHSRGTHHNNNNNNNNNNSQNRFYELANAVIEKNPGDPSLEAISKEGKQASIIMNE